MHSRGLKVAVACCLFLTAAQSARGSDDFSAQREVLNETLGYPLRTLLLHKGYTPRNADVAASNLLDLYAQCLVTEQDVDSDAEPELTTIRMGDAVIAVYRSPCLTEFLDNIRALT